MDIVKNRRIWFSLSGLLLLLAISAFAFNAFTRSQPMNFGIDFTGGTMLNLRFQRPVTVAEVRGTLEQFKLGDSVIQRSGENDVLVRAIPLDEQIRSELVEALNEKLGGVELLEADIIGPTIGRELTTQAFWALLLASLGIIIYVSFRFEFKYAATALIALYHDAIITTGIIALLWRTVDVPFVAAILTIMGYSINDTIIIYDRIRENLKKPSKGKKNYAAIVNVSIKETLARSINTVLTSVVMVFALLVFGGETTRDFALTMLIGFVIGSFSSIFVAPPLLAAWQEREDKLSK